MFGFFWRCFKGMISSGVHKSTHTSVDWMGNLAKRSGMVSENTINQTTNKVKSMVTVGEQQYNSWKFFKRVTYTVISYPIVLGGTIGAYSGVQNGLDLRHEFANKPVKKYLLLLIGTVGYGLSGIFSGVYWCARHPIYMPIEFLKDPHTFRINEYPPKNRT